MTRKTMFLIALLLSLVALISYWGIIKPSNLSNEATEQVSVRNNGLKIAIVNEDAGTVYNGQPLNVAQLLTTSFSSKSGYPIEVVSRSIAEQGRDNGIYQLMVILPSRFSEDSLALETTSPHQAVFQYQIKSDKSHLIKQAEQAVVDLKSLFNKDLIHIYFLSIIGNLQTAQGQVGEVINADNRVLLNFESNLLNPLNLYAKQFTGVSTSPTELLAAYSNFQKGLLGSNDAFTSIVDVNKLYTGEIDQIRSLQEQWQESILKREDSLKAYDDAFSKLSIEEQLNQLVGLQETMTSEHSNPEVHATTKTGAIELKEEVLSLVETLKSLNSQIDDALDTYDSKIESAVTESLATNPEFNMNGQARTLGAYLQTIRRMLLEQFKSELGHFRGFSDETIDRMALSEVDKDYLKSINRFVSEYTRNHEEIEVFELQTTSAQEERLAEARQYVLDSLRQEREMTLSSLEGQVSGISLTVSEGYELEWSSLPIASYGGQTYRLAVPDSKASSITVSYKLKSVDGDINLLTPVSVRLDVQTKEEMTYFTEEAREIVSSVSDTTTPNVAPAESNSTTEIDETDASQSSSDIAGDSRSEDEVSDSPAVHYNRQEKTIERTYTEARAFLPYKDFVFDGGRSRETSAFSDFRPYFELAGVIKAYFGRDLSDVNWSSPSEGSLIQRMMAKESDTEELKAIIVSLIQEATVSELKGHLKVSEEQLSQFENLSPKAEELAASIDQLSDQTSQLLDQLGQTVQETRLVHDTMAQKPTFVEEEKRDNTDLVTVSMGINSDLEKLRSASQTLMDSTKSHQLVSETIQGQIDNLANEVKTLETEGAGLEGRVTELHGVMTKEYAENADFLKSFTTVLSNTKVGHSPNSVVYDYLSNPVDASKIEQVVGAVTKKEVSRQDERSGFLLILLTYLVSLGTSYILQHSDTTKWPRLVAPAARRHWTNSLIPFVFLTGLSVISSLLMGIISGHRLSLSSGQTIVFSLLLFVLHQLFTHGINNLSQYLKSYGFLISLSLVMLYLISAGQLLDSHYVSHNTWLSYVSPLTYIEAMLTAFLNHKGGWTSAFIIVLLFAGLVSGLTVYCYKELDETGV